MYYKHAPFLLNAVKYGWVVKQTFASLCVFYRVQSVHYCVKFNKHEFLLQSVTNS